MIQGMTGFASKIITIASNDEKANVSLQLKTLNSRYFEANFKLPHALSFLEIDLTKLCKKKLYRGYINFTIYIDNPALFKGTISPAMNVIGNYVTAIDKVKNQFSLQDTLTLPMILNLPNIFCVEEKTIDEKAVKTIIEACNELINSIIGEREKEGIFIKKDLEERLNLMEKDIIYIEERSQFIIAHHKEKVHTVLKELEGDGSDLADARKNAIFTVLDKIDIHEEVVRFKNHVNKMQNLLDAPGIEKGKRIDFTLQEMAREINTIAAKCSDSDISSNAIDIKVEIEKAREQAQNIV